MAGPGGVMPQSVGELVDSLAVPPFDLEDNQRLTDVLIIGRVADLDSGGTGMVIGRSRGLDWITGLGLITAAGHALKAEAYEGEDDCS
jgi:hypothetical protein